MGSTTESHLLCQLFFAAAIFPWERISAVRITAGSVRALSYLAMKEGKMEEGGVKGRGGIEERRSRAPPGMIIIPEISLLRPLGSSSSRFHDQVLRHVPSRASRCILCLALSL